MYTFDSICMYMYRSTYIDMHIYSYIYTYLYKFNTHTNTHTPAATSSYFWHHALLLGVIA